MQEYACYKCYGSDTMFLNDVIQIRYSDTFFQARSSSNGQGLKGLHFSLR